MIYESILGKWIVVVIECKYIMLEILVCMTCTATVFRVMMSD